MKLGQALLMTAACAAVSRASADNKYTWQHMGSKLTGSLSNDGSQSAVTLSHVCLDDQNTMHADFNDGRHLAIYPQGLSADPAPLGGTVTPAGKKSQDPTIDISGTLTDNIIGMQNIYGSWVLSVAIAEDAAATPACTAKTTVAPVKPTTAHKTTHRDTTHRDTTAAPATSAAVTTSLRGTTHRPATSATTQPHARTTAVPNHDFYDGVVEGASGALLAAGIGAMVAVWSCNRRKQQQDQANNNLAQPMLAVVAEYPPAGVKGSDGFVDVTAQSSIPVAESWSRVVGV